MSRLVARLAVIVLALVAVFAFVFAPSAAATVAQFGSAGSGAGQFSEARGLAVEQESGDVYLVDRGNGRVERWSGEGVFLEAWGSGGEGAGEFGQPLGVAVDNSLGLSHGDVYVVDAENNRVQQFGPHGEFKLMFGGEVNATRVKEAEEGKSVTAAEEDICTQTEIESGVECKAGAPGSAAGEFAGWSNPEGEAPIAVDSEGRVYVGDPAGRVQRFSVGGVYEATVLAGVGGIERLAAAPGGDIYVVSAERAGVREYDSSGAEVGPARDETGQPIALAAGPGGSLFVEDGGIRVYDAAGAETQLFDEGGEEDWYPGGIAWGEGAGALYVADEFRVRVVPQPPPGPVVRPRSELASEVDPTTAVLDAIVNPEDQEGEGEYEFEYGTGACTPASCGSATPAPAGKLPKSFEGDPVEAQLSGLQPKTTYHFRVVASDSVGNRTVGPEASLTTLPAVQIEETHVSDVASTSATFSAVLDPLGVAASWRIEYAGEPAKLGTPEAMIAGEGTLATGFAGVGVSAHVQSGLSATKTYYYRVVAQDEREGISYVEYGPEDAFTTQGEGEVLALPDGRAWELVSPPARHGAAINVIPENAPVQAAAGGGAIAYATNGAIEAAAEGNRPIESSMVLSTHGVGGSSSWSSRDIATANENVTEGFVAGTGDGYQLFSPDLSTAMVQPKGTTPLPPLPPTAERTLYLRHADGSFQALVTAANVEAGVHFGGALKLLGATPDLAHVVFQSGVSLVHNAGAGLYEWSAGHLQFLAPEGTLGSPQGSLSEFNTRGAVASEGTRVFYSIEVAAHEYSLYMFDTETEKTVQLDTVQPGATGVGQQKAFYQDTSVETSAQGAAVTKAFFTDGQALTRGASAGSLYQYDTQTGELSDLTVPVNAGESAGVQGLVPGVSEDGSYVYVVAAGVLTTNANVYGETATSGLGNLYELHLQGGSWQPTFIATLSGSDSPDWGGPSLRLSGLAARVSPDGHYLAFMSQRSLTGYDNRDAISGAADEEVYLYDAHSAKLVCASCNPSGARPTGIDDVEVEGHKPLVDAAVGSVWPEGTWLAASVPGWTLKETGEALYQSRYLDDAGRLFFDSADALVPQAVNHTENVYEYEPPGAGGSQSSLELNDGCTTVSSRYSPAALGCIDLVSSGTGSQESMFLDASESGDDVFFLSAARLTPQAPASGYNVYDAHVCGAGWACAASQPVSVAPCESPSECRAPSLPGAGGAPASASFEGAGNLPAAATSKPKTLTRAQKLAAALKACKPDRKKTRRQKCEKAARAKYGVKAKKSGSDRGRGR